MSMTMESTSTDLPGIPISIKAFTGTTKPRDWVHMIEEGSDIVYNKWQIYINKLEFFLKDTNSNSSAIVRRLKLIILNEIA